VRKTGNKRPVENLKAQEHPAGESNGRPATVETETKRRRIHIVEPLGVYTPDQIREVLGLRDNSIPREIRAGRLRVAKRCGRYFILGSWIISWLEAGIVARGRPAHDPLLNGAGGVVDAGDGIRTK